MLFDSFQNNEIQSLNVSTSEWPKNQDTVYMVQIFKIAFDTF